MPINPDVVGAKSAPARRGWASTDCLLYALSVGAGMDDPSDELEFTTENTADTEQRVLPTMAVVLANTGTVPSLGSFDRAMLVHGEQGLTLHREIPVEGELEAVSEVVAVYDKGKGAVVVTETRATLVGSNEPLFDSRSSAYIRGEGGWGGDRGPSGPQHVAREAAPDFEIGYHTRFDQALLYRLNGDRNPLHTDPSFAAIGGFDRPILHGLCTYGFTGRALLHGLCAGDPARFRSMDGRFSSPVMPGEALTTQMWVVGDGEAVFRTQSDDGRIVLESGRCTFTA